MRVLLTGASGFVGSYLLRRLLADGRNEVAVLLRPTSDTWRIAGELGQVRRLSGDLDDLAAVAKDVKAFAPEVVIHLAWYGVGNAQRNDPRQVRNIGAAVSLVEMAREAGAAHWIGLGSQAEYGPCEGAIREDQPTRPTTLYGISKLAAGLSAGQLCRDWGMRFAWLRLFSSYGPMDDPSWMIPYLIGKLLDGQRPALTAGTQLWDYIYVEDVAQAIERVALHPHASGVFNLGSGRAPALRTIVERIRDEIDPGLPLGFGEVPFRPDQVMHLEADIGRLRDVAGWSPEVDLDEGLRRTIAWYRRRRGGER